MPIGITNFNGVKCCYFCNTVVGRLHRFGCDDDEGAMMACDPCEDARQGRVAKAKMFHSEVYAD